MVAPAIKNRRFGSQEEILIKGQRVGRRRGRDPGVFACAIALKLAGMCECSLDTETDIAYTDMFF